MNPLQIENFTIDKSDWIKVKLGDVVFEPKESVADPVAEGIEHVVGLEHIDSDDIHLRRSESIEGGSTTFTKKFAKGDVLFGRRRAYLRKAAQAEFDGICSGDITVLRAKKGLMPELLPFIVNNDKFFDYAITHSAGGLSPRVKFKDLSGYEFLLPPKEQQAELAELLWANENDIRSKRIIGENLEILKRRISQSHYYDSNIPRLRISDVCEKIQDGSHFSPSALFDENDGTRYIYLTSKNIRSTGLDMGNIQYVDADFHKGIYKRCDPQIGDVLLTKDGANTGLATINTIDEEMSLLSSVCLLRVDAKRMTNLYLCQYLNSDIGFTHMTGRMTGTAIKRLTLKTINGTKIPCPSLQKQKAICEEFEAVDNAINFTRRYILASYSLQKSLINQVF